MNRFAWMLAASLSLGSAYGAPSSPGAMPSFTPLDCPTSAEGWTKWKEATVRGLESPASLADPGSPIGRLEFCQTLASQKVFFENSEFQACMKPLRMISKIRVSHGEGYQVTNEALSLDADQYNDPKRVPFPEMLTRPKELDADFFEGMLGGTMSLDVMKKRVQRIQRINPGIHAVQYISHFGGRVSTVIVIPGDDYDRYIHIGQDTKGHFAESVFMVAIQKRDAKHQAIDPPKSFFTQYFLPRVEEKVLKNDKNRVVGYQHHFSTKMPQASQEIGPCISCHRVGAMPLVPEDMKTATALTRGQSGAEVISWINSRVAETAGARADSMDYSAYGPPMGEVDPPQRTDEFIARCSSRRGLKLSADDTQKVKDAMNCAQCHNGEPKQPGILNFPVGLQDFEPSLFEHMVHKGHMPPGSDLSPTQISAVIGCLSDEYYGGFGDPKLSQSKEPGAFMRWLTAARCPDSVVPAAAQFNGSKKGVKENTQDSSSPDGATSRPAH